MDNASTFIRIFKEFEDWMGKKTKKTGYVGFSDMLHELKGQHGLIQGNVQFLQKMAEVRNVITHNKDILIQPTDQVVEQFRTLIALITKPPGLLQYCAKNPTTVSEEEFLPGVLRQMGAHDYSQIIVRGEKKYRLLSREGVSKWIEANIENDLVSIGDTKVADVLAHEDEGTCEFVGRNTDVFVFLELLSDPKRRIQAVIITERGRPNEKPLGIATAWDAGAIIKELSIA